MRISTRRTESFTAQPTQVLLGGGPTQERNPEGSIKQLMSRLKVIQPNTMKVSRRENDAVYHNFEYEPAPRKSKKGGFFIERQIRNLKAREDSKRISLKHKQETAAEKAARAQRQKDMEKMKIERDRKFRMNEQIKLDRE